MELIKGTGIIVNAWKVQQITNAYNKNPKEIVRKLMKMIIGEEKLKNMSPTGKNDRDPIPENIYEAVERKQIQFKLLFSLFINRNTACHFVKQVFTLKF